MGSLDVPITDVMSDKGSVEWIVDHVHAPGVRCPDGQARWAAAREFRRTHRRELIGYRCRRWRGMYAVYSGTIFEARQWRPTQVVVLVRGVLTGERAARLARELGMRRTTISELRHLIQANAAHLQPEKPLADNAGKKGDEHFDPLAPPR